MAILADTSFPGLLSAEVARDPYAFYRRLRAEAPLHWDEGAQAYLLTRHAAVSTGYRHPAFTTRNYEWQLEPVFGRSLLQMGGGEHSRKRALVSPHFRGAGLDAWSGTIHRNVAQILDGTVERAVDILLDPVQSGEEFDLLTRFAHYLPVFVIADMLDLPRSDYRRFWGWYNAMIAFLSNLARDSVVHDAGVRATRELREYLGPIVAARRADPGSDLISVLTTAEFEGQSLGDDEIMTHVTQLLNAGSETTDKTIGSLFAHLLIERERYEEVHDDRSLVVPAISETLRLTPPSQMNGRVLAEDVEIEGGVLPEGSTVYLVIASANRDERRFADPEVYDMHRTDLSHQDAFSARGEHFAFGHGRHFCLGAMLARAELTVALGAVLDRFPDLRLAPDFVPHEAGLKMRATAELRVVA
ncbi:cytochrome P450 [Pseudonocardia sp. NPDC049154]|uniref:cytochrome P450 n=1 Tax=Pseudonocardia sp. NPDC049154 TaxID=3155501 RepID=UPI003406229E